MSQRRYVEPGVLDGILNSVVNALTRLGISLYGSRILAVRGRKSGHWRMVPVNLLEHEGVHYLVAPRGETEWVRNLRTSGTGELRLGSRRDVFRAIELEGAEKLPILRAYLDRWWFEVSRFFDLAGPQVSDSEIARVEPQHPVFRIEY